jgi:hypothetical protein
MAARDAVHSVKDCGVQNGETARGDGRCCAIDANSVERSIVPICYDVGNRGSAKNGYADNEERSSK